jgi:fatty acid-binding protein DegV
MRTLVLTADKANPRVVVELKCDIDLLIACIKDGELKPEDVAKTLNSSMAKIIEALHKGVAKRKQEAAE